MRRTFCCRNNESPAIASICLQVGVILSGAVFQAMRSVGVRNLRMLEMKSANSRLFLAALVIVCLSAISYAQVSHPELRIQDVTVIDVKGGPPHAHQCVTVKNAHITDVAGAERCPKRLQGDAVWIDGKGKYLIPGLWDMHVHMVFGDWFPRGKEVTLPLFVANGITGVRDMGGELEVLQQWRKEISAGTLIG